MQRLNIASRPHNPYKQGIDNLKSLVANQSANFGGKEATNNILSMESLNDSAFANLERTAEGIALSLESHFSGLEADAAIKLTPAQKTAGAMVAMAYGNPGEYHKAALTRKAVSQEGVRMSHASNFGAAGLLDYTDQVEPAMEAFDDRELQNSMAYSIQFNVEAARQDDASELAYPTIVVGPDQAAIDVTVGRYQVHKEIRRKSDGTETNWHLRNLIDAHRDATILADEETRVYPVVAGDDSNAASFVDAAIVGERTVIVSGFDITTAPLALRKKHEIIGLSAHPELMANQILDNSDALDARLALETLYVQLADGETGVPVDVSRLPLNSFLKTIEGQSKDLSLRFTSVGITLNAATRTVDQSTPAVVADLATSKYTVKLRLQAFGDANVQYATVRVDAPEVEVYAILDENSDLVDLKSGAGLAIVEKLKDARIVGYDLKAYRTNSNRRTRGMQLDVQWETERYVIPLGSPISAPSPITASRDASDLKALTNAVRIRNSNNAITTLFNYAAALRDYVAGPQIKGSIAPLEGMGRFLVTPFYEELELDLEKEINSIRSWDKAFDVSACLVNAVRDITYRMYQKSGYQQALDAHAGSGNKPVLGLITDQVITRHLMVQGDTRTWATVFDEAKQAVSVDSRIDGHIVMFFTRPSAQGADPLNFGNFAWIPELTSSVMVNRNGATIKEAMVQPRARHFNNCPIMAIIKVKNLDKVLTLKSTVAVDSTDVTPVVDPGTGAGGGTGNGGNTGGGTGGNGGTGGGTGP